MEGVNYGYMMCKPLEDIFKQTSPAGKDPKECTVVGGSFSEMRYAGNDVFGNNLWEIEIKYNK